MKRWCSVLMVIAVLLALCTPLIVTADTMSASDKCIDFIKRREGFSAKPYWDNSQWTVGYGTRCPADKLEEYQKNGITQEAALELLASMIKDFEKSIHRYIEKHELTLTQQQFDALVSFSFNCGAGWTSETSGYLNTAVREGWTGSKFLYAMCLWSRSGGDYILMNRRFAESHIYLSGDFVNSNSDIPDNYRCVYLDGNGGTVRYIPHGFDANDPIKIIYDFKSIPDGCTFNGWYTQDNVKVEVLDATIPSGTVLYAQWVDSTGAVVSLPKGEEIKPVNVTVQKTVNTRVGPGTFYESLGKVEPGTKLTVQELYTFGGRTWGLTQSGWVALSYTDYETVIQVPETWPKDGTVNATHVNVRSGPGLSFDRQYQVSTGTKVTIHEMQAADGLDWGKLEDGNWICLTYVTFHEEPEDKPDEPELPTDPPDEPTDEIPPTEPTDPEPTVPPPLPGDVNNDIFVNKDDAIYLLRHVLFPEKYPLHAEGDIDKDNDVDKDDAIYLLRHVLFPEKYPIQEES